MKDSLRKYLLVSMFAFVSVCGTSLLSADTSEYALGPGDIIHITVYENPELTSDVRVTESGSITFPLIGSVSIAGLTIPQAQATIAKKLSEGHFVAQPQVNILPTQIVGSQITVIGYVNKPGRYPLQTMNTRVSDAIAFAGGIDPTGAETIILIRHQPDKDLRIPLDVNDVLVQGSQQDRLVQSGDTLYVPRQPIYYIYGEVTKPGSYRLERQMTVMQAMAVGGYSNERGSKWRTQIFRQSPDGSMHEVELQLTDQLMANDVIYVRLRML